LVKFGSFIPQGFQGDLAGCIPGREFEAVKDIVLRARVAVLTNLELISALVKILREEDYSKFTVGSLNEYMESLPWNRW
jgi:hypothetical protein